MCCTYQEKTSYPRRIIAIICIAAASACLCTAILFFAIRYHRRRPKKNAASIVNLKFEYKKVSYNDIFKATDGFSSVNLIGKGTFGTVYKATMIFDDQPINVATKVIVLEQHGATESFFRECEALRNIRHRNLVKILSSCSSTDHNGNDFKALIFEFMPNGSLETWLHTRTSTDNRSLEVLTLIQRIDIAIEVATALDYLHHHGTVPIVHCDLKPSNVLLDEEMIAHVGDFGLAKLLVQEGMIHSQSASMGIRGTIGYIPPEYGMGSQASTQGDVYSYGILLLEIFTGVSPTDERFTDGSNLLRLVEMSFPDKIMKIVDHKLMLTNGEKDIEGNAYEPENVYECLLSVTQCALMCCKESPNERISIKEVAKELNSAREKLLA